MTSLAPILLLFLFAFSMIMNQSRQKKGDPKKKSPPGAQSRKDSAAMPEESPSRPAAPEPAPREPLRPTIAVSLPDDSFYQGSLNAVTGEGVDPCHDDQLRPLTDSVRAEQEAPPAAAPGLALSWTGEDIVRGFVMSEILKRKT